MSNCVERFFLTKSKIDVNIAIEFEFQNLIQKIFFEKNQKINYTKKEVIVNACLNSLK